MNYLITENMPNFQQFAQLHEESGLIKNKRGNYTKEKLYEAAKNSWYSISIYQSEQLIAFGRLISDGIYQALICDVMVHPNFQGKGLGKTVIEELITKCKESDIQSIQLFSAKGKHSFYKKLGFQEREQDAPGMTFLI